MQKAKKEALMLTKYFVCLPHPAKTSLFILAVSFIFGIMFSIARKQPLGPFELFAAGVDGIFVLAIPSMLSALCLFFMRRKATFRRSAFMGLISVFIYGPFYLAASALAPVGEWASNLVFLGFAFSFGIWFFTLFLVFDFRRSAFLFAAIQAIFFALFFLIQGGFPAEANFQELLLKIYFASFVLLALFYSLFYFVSLPLKKNLGISSFDALSMFASQWLYGDTSLEEAFEEIGEEAETLVWVGKFQGRKNSAIFVVPHIHFGPFGNLGGSEFTYRISQLLSSPGPKKSEVFVFHGTATHDLNPVSSSEISKVIAACRLALSRLKLQEAKMAHSWCKVGSVRAQAFYLNDSAFLSFSRAPQTTEDVSLGLGLAVMERAKRTCSTVAVVDEHNSETGDISSVEVGSPIGFEMLDATSRLFSQKPQLGSFKFACSSSSIMTDSIGRNGLKLALFLQGRKMHALLLADSNGILPEFREELVRLLEALGAEHGYSCTGEIMTTDTHQTNMVQGVLNPLGRQNRGDVMMAVRAIFAKAVKSLEEVQFGAAEERFRIKVFGAGQSAEIASTINAAVAILRAALPIILIASVLLLVWALGKI